MQLGEEPDVSLLGGSGKEASSSSSSDGTGVLEKGTATLRLHVKNKTILEMRDRGECVSLCFQERSVDIGCDGVAQRDLLARGFRLLQQAF